MLRALLLLTLLCGALPVRAAPAPEQVAKAHYARAEALYARGDYEEAIDEYERAYRLKPHPNTIYNIAQAYERLLDYAQSVQWFERYLREAPADAPNRPLVTNRLRILRNLPARISVSTIPEHVQASLIGADGARHEAATPTVFKVPADRYTLQLAEPGWEPEAHQLEVAIGQPYFYQYRLKRSVVQLSVSSRPRGARVFLDDRLMGETPFTGSVEVGTHRLLLEHQDYPAHAEELVVHPGVPIKREIRLTRPLRSGRTELVIAAMIYGGAAGPVLMSSILGDSKFGTTGYGLLVYMLSSAAGMGSGFLGAFLTTREGVKVGQSSLMVGGAAFGTSLFASLALGLEVPTKYVYALAIAGSGVGMGAGYLIARRLNLSPGDAGLVNSGGLWGTAAGVLLAQSIFRDPAASTFGWFIFGGTTLGVLGGSLLAAKLELGRGHVGLIDVGGLGGTGLGFALGYVIGVNSGGEDNVQVGARYALGGMALGLLAGAILTRKYKGDVPPVRALLRHEGGRWALGLPAISIEPALTPEGRAPRLSFTLAQGHF